MARNGRLGLTRIAAEGARRELVPRMFAMGGQEPTESETVRPLGVSIMNNDAASVISCWHRRGAHLRGLASPRSAVAVAQQAESA
jgi:hypothetical protein